MKVIFPALFVLFFYPVPISANIFRIDCTNCCYNLEYFLQLQYHILPMCLGDICKRPISTVCCVLEMSPLYSTAKIVVLGVHVLQTVLQCAVQERLQV